MKGRFVSFDAHYDFWRLFWLFYSMLSIIIQAKFSRVV